MSQETKENQIDQMEVKKSGPKITLPTAIVIAGLLVAGAILLPKISIDREAAIQDASANAVAALSDTQSSLELVNNISDKDFIQGAENPKVTIVEFSDFGCSFCALFHPTVKRLVEEYPNDIAWVYRHLPYRNIEAAQASECVGQELGDEAFWEYTSTLFEKQHELSRDLLAQEAVSLGFKDSETFWECQSSESVQEAVQRDYAEARLLGASGTPFSLVVTDSGRHFPIRGASSYEQLKQIVDILITQE